MEFSEKKLRAYDEVLKAVRDYKGFFPLLQIIERLELAGWPYLVCICPIGEFAGGKVDVERKLVKCRKCSGWKPVSEVEKWD